MTDVLYDVAQWVVAVAFLFAVAFAVLWGMQVARDWAADRKREQEYADEFLRTHRPRHDHTDDRRPE
jgi:cell division protein FtsI/penicillin-binding protein 2